MLFHLFYSIFDGNPCWKNNVYSDQMPHYVASGLGLHCLPYNLYGFPGKNGLIGNTLYICIPMMHK